MTPTETALRARLTDEALKLAIAAADGVDQQSEWTIDEWCETSNLDAMREALVAALTPRADAPPMPDHAVLCNSWYGGRCDCGFTKAPTPDADEPRRVKPPMMGPPYDPMIEQHRDLIKPIKPPTPDAEGPATWRPATSDWEDLRRWLRNQRNPIDALDVLIFMEQSEPDAYRVQRNGREPDSANPPRGCGKPIMHDWNQPGDFCSACHGYHAIEPRAPTPTERG